MAYFQEKMEKEQSERLSRPGRVIKPIAPPDPALEKRSRAPESSMFRIWWIFSREPGGDVPVLQNETGGIIFPLPQLT